MSLSLAAVVLTRNEEPHIGACLDSLAWVPQRFIVDDSSSDRTADIAREKGAVVIDHRLENFAAQRDFALGVVETDWVLFVDADERVTPALAAEVKEVLSGPDRPEVAGWWIPRHNMMIGHRMRGGGWYPDHQLRLLRRTKACYDPSHPVHEIVVLDGEAGYLEGHLLHYNYDSVAQFRRKMRRYTVFEAQILLGQGTRLRPWTQWSMPPREFWRRFVTLGGYRDHAYGLLFCGLMAWYTFITYRRLGRLRSSNSGTG